MRFGSSCADPTTRAGAKSPVARCLPVQNTRGRRHLLVGGLAFFILGFATTAGFPTTQGQASEHRVIEIGVIEIDAQAIRQVVSAQLDAFRRDDWEEAFGFASPSVQRQFGGPDQFRAMVIAGYQPVYRPRETRFGEIINFQGRPAQQVHVIGPDGIPVLAIYPMERQKDGVWRIAGCFLLPVEDRAA